MVLDYGVVDPAVRKPAFVLTLELPDGCANFDDKIDILELNGLSQQVAYTLRPRENPSMEMMAFLRLLNLGGADAFLLEALFRNRVWQEHLMLPVSEENERMVCESMLTGCSEALDALGDAASQDMATLQTCSPLSRWVRPRTSCTSCTSGSWRTALRARCSGARGCAVS